MNTLRSLPRIAWFAAGRVCVLAAILSWFASSAAAAEAPPVLDAAKRQAIVADVSRLLQENYVYEETAKKMSDLIQSRLQQGTHDGVADPSKFADLMMTDLRSVSHDKHLAFHYDPNQAASIRNADSKDESLKKQEEEKYRAELAADNFGFRKVERMQGNVGYLDFRFFANPRYAGDTAVAALNFLSRCSAVIIDLRQNGGGEPEMIQLISTYFFRESTHLNDIYTRRTNSTENYWTLPFVPGQRMPDADLYILTSSFTFSGAEEFTYNMKNLKRATIVGEVTGGGAHPVEGKIVQNDFVLDVPYARAINPISKTNWEGTGITPDVQVPAGEAMDRAYEIALEKLVNSKDPAIRQQAEWTLAGVKAKRNPVKVSDADLAGLAGTYESRKVTMENGGLYYQRFGPKLRMIPLTATLFALEGLDDFRVEFVIRGGAAAELVGISSDGMREPSKRTN